MMCVGRRTWGHVAGRRDFPAGGRTKWLGRPEASGRSDAGELGDGFGAGLSGAFGCCCGPWVCIRAEGSAGGPPQPAASGRRHDRRGGGGMDRVFGRVAGLDGRPVF